MSRNYHIRDSEGFVDRFDRANISTGNQYELHRNRELDIRPERDFVDRFDRANISTGNQYEPHRNREYDIRPERDFVDRSDRANISTGNQYEFHRNREHDIRPERDFVDRSDRANISTGNQYEPHRNREHDIRPERDFVGRFDRANISTGNQYEFHRNRERDIRSERDSVYEQHVSRDRDFYSVREEKLSRAGYTMRYEAYHYPRQVKEYLEPVIRNEQVMEHAAETFFRLDEEPSFLAKSSTAFLEGMGSVPDESDDRTESGTEEESVWDPNYDDYESEESELGLGTGNVGPCMTEEGSGNGAQSTGFMRWSGFKPYPLSNNPDVVGDRRKSILSIAQAVEIGVPTPIGPVTMKGLFGVLALVLQPRDYRAYFKATGRKILLPDSISKRPDELKLEEYERNLLGTGKYIDNSPMMTCLTYSNHDYGTITLFNVEMTETGEGEWPERIRPLAAMIGVPKKLLKQMAKSVPRSKKTILQVKTKASRPLKWVSFPSESEPAVAYSPNVQRSKMSESIRKALAIDSGELEFQPGTIANFVFAAIPEMIAWLHVKASYLVGVDIQGTKFLRGGEERSKVRRIVSWKNGPGMIEHEGKDPRIVVLHPNGGDWVTAPVYWS